MSVTGQLKTNMCKFTWTLKDFSKLGQDCKGQVISPIYNLRDLHWKMTLFPYGNRNDRESLKEFISLYLELESRVESNVAIQVYFELMMSNTTGTELKQKSAIGAFTSKSKGLGWIQFIGRDVVLQNKDNLPGDILYISCTLHSDVYNSREVNIQKTVLHDYESLFFNENFSDLTIIINNNKMKVHKNILSARSTVFQAMLRHDMEESNTSVINITDVSYNIMKEILLFIYSGKVNDLHKNAKKLLPPADKYGIIDLKVLCEKSIWKNVKIEDACETLSFANLYQCVELKAKIIEFIIANMKEVTKTSGFKDLNRSNSELFEEIFAKVVEKKF